jgi:hypothetical protein
MESALYVSVRLIWLWRQFPSGLPGDDDWLAMSQAMAWSLVVGHALNLVLDKVSATSVYSLGIAAS